ncbi:MULTISPECIES: recombinase family protein [Streptomyces]|uniref:recombinase family protein n=2 Tax=Streptomyces TaxID=1883 RepID=UPI001EE2C6AA|nr:MULTISPECIES: recombinase family protein [Streptomyces]MDX2927753.1 recombinase family protein [Streptomyces sp. NRRL_B-16638]MDX3411080.1 recombinase family protein [Streptomyces sp. ME02-6977A]WMT35876.1 recombinase family protein [Streptomyces coelicolor]
MDILEHMTEQRAVIAIYLRLSRESDDSTSLETQRSFAHRWLLAHGYDPADAVEYIDASVSGAKPLEARKGMAALMAARPTVVVAWKLDRFARSVSDFLRLVAWAEAHGASIATTDNAIDTTTATGRMVATVLAALAEWERNAIASRITDGHATRRSQGRWSSGRPPFGYRIERRDGAAYLAIDDDQAAKIRKAVAALVNGSTVAATARLTGLSEPQWRRLLKSPTLRGQRAHKGELVCEVDGITPVKFAEPILSAAELLKVRERMLALATGQDRAPRRATPMCSGMAFCHRCAGKLNGGTSDKGVPLYRCKAGHVTIYAETLDSRVESEFLTTFGSYAETVIRLEGGNDLSAELLEAKEQAERLAARMATAGPLMLGTLESLAQDLEDTHARLRAAHDPDVREVQVATGRTMAQAWEMYDVPDRSRLLAGMGLRVSLHPRQLADRLTITWGPTPEEAPEAEWDGLALSEAL